MRCRTRPERVPGTNEVTDSGKMSMDETCVWPMANLPTYLTEAAALIAKDTNHIRERYKVFRVLL